MKNSKSFVCYQNKNDEEVVLRIFSSLPKQYKFENNTIKYISIFCSETIKDKIHFQKINLSDDFNKSISKIINDSICDIRKYYKFIDEKTQINKNGLITLFGMFKNNLENNQGLIVSLINILLTNNLFIVDNKLTNLLIKIVIFNNILIYFGYFIKWDKNFNNSYIGFWSQIFSLILEFEKDIDVIKTKIISSITSHLFLHNLNPIFYDDGKENKDTSKENVFINFEFENNLINFSFLDIRYDAKTKIIDRILLKICNEIE